MEEERPSPDALASVQHAVHFAFATLQSLELAKAIQLQTLSQLRTICRSRREMKNSEKRRKGKDEEGHRGGDGTMAGAGKQR